MGESSWSFSEVDTKSAPDEVLHEAAEFSLALERELHPDELQDPVETIVAAWRSFPERLFTKAVHVHDGGLLIGRAVMFWHDVSGNDRSVRAGVSVRSSLRRRGLGRDLLRAVLELVPEAAETVTGRTESEAGEGFARKFGLVPANEVHVNRVLLDRVDLELIQRWAVDVVGYTVMAVDGRMPDALVEAFADVYHAMIDAPRGELATSERRMTVEDVRSLEDQVIGSGQQIWHLIAREDASGALAGFTSVILDPRDPHKIEQHDTGVRREHRRRGLGKLLKARMLQRILVECPDAREIRTTNADANAAMLAVNSRLGFEPFQSIIEWHGPLEGVREAVS